MKFGFYSSISDPNMTRVYADLLEEFREQVVLCEQAGFDIAWADEHHFYAGSNTSPNPLLAGAMLAAHTSSIRIGLPVILPNWHPLRLAEDVAVLDHLSRGRVEVAMGRGGTPFDVSNLNPALTGLWPDRSVRHEANRQTASREHFAEVLDILKKAWTGEAFAHEGRYYKFPQPGLTLGSAATPRDATAVRDGEIAEMRVGPKPYQDPHPPLRMLMSSEPSFKEGAELGLKGWAWIYAPRRLRQILQVYSDVRTEREGRRFRLGEDVGALRLVYVAPSYEEAKRDADQFFTPYLAQACRSRPQSYYVDEDEDAAADIDLNWEFLRERLLLLAGSPEQVAEQIHELDEICGIDTIALWTQAARAGDGLSHKKIMSSLELFAEKVLPLFSAKKEDDKVVSPA